MEGTCTIINLLLHKLDLSSRQREIVNVWLHRENLWDFDLNDMQGCAFQQGMEMEA